ncbi:MAG: HIT domain-containing protein [Anaerolineaceae bacterium]|nr:HIT domain-containing protein [Anaerolineaceae bacterium]
MDKHLWTPWRMAYIRGDKEPAGNCVFCAKAHTDDDASEMIVARSAYVYVTLNRYPYNNGHLLVVPYAHIESQEVMPPEALTDLMVTVNRALAVLRQAYQPAGFNLGVNLGADAGAGIAAHYHFHIVPRWPGDSNFMSVVGATRVIPDTLDNTYTELKAIWHDLYEEEEEEHGE